MGERQPGSLFGPAFNRAVRVEPAAIDLTEDTGAILLREAAEQLDLVAALGDLADPRDPLRVTHPLVELVLTRVLLIGQGWGDQDDADTLRDDAALRIAVSQRRGAQPLEASSDRAPSGLASQPTLSRLTDILSTPGNLARLRSVLLQVGVKRLQLEEISDELTLDVDSFPTVAHGRQEGAVYNGHFHDTALHPLAVFAHTGDLLAIEQRPGNAHTAKDVREILGPVLDATQDIAGTIWVRFDAGFAAGAFFDWLDEREAQWITRLRTNAALKRQAESWVERTRRKWARDTDPNEPRTATYEFWYRAGSWTRQRRVVAVLVERNDREGELFDNLFFLCTSARRPIATSAEILTRYRQRGRAEAAIGEFVQETRPALSSTPMDHNQVNALLSALAHQLMHHVRRRIVTQTGEGLSLRRLRERVLKVATHVVRHARRVIFRISRAKVAIWEVVRQALEPPSPLAEEGATAN